jgi:molybdopterin converting factor small subunit
MSVQFEFLGPLKQLVRGTETVQAEGDNIRAALENLGEQYPGLIDRLLGENDLLHTHINIYINEEDIRLKDSLSTAVSPHDRITVISAIAGG